MAYRNKSPLDKPSCFAYTEPKSFLPGGIPVNNAVLHSSYFYFSYYRQGNGSVCCARDAG